MKKGKLIVSMCLSMVMIFGNFCITKANVDRTMQQQKIAVVKKSGNVIQKGYISRINYFEAQENKASLLNHAKTEYETQGIVGNLNWYHVKNPSVYPYSPIGCIRIDWPDNKQGWGTAFMISRYKAATAAHCLYSSEHGGWAKSIRFWPGYKLLFGGFEVEPGPIG